MTRATETTHTVKRLVWLAAVAIAAATAAVGAQAASAADACLRVNEVYAVGGTATSTYDRDFVELRNVCGTAQGLNPATLVIWPVEENPNNGANVSLGNITIPANGYYLIGFGTPAGPGASFTADKDYGSALATANAMAGLTNTGVQFNPCVPVDGGIYFDLVGYGTSPPCSETAPAAAPSETQSISRDLVTSADTDNNSVDFTLQAPTPRSSSSPTSVHVSAFSAAPTKGGVLVRWHVPTIADVLGFHVYRQVGGKRVRVNARLIAANGRGAYSFLDRLIPRAKSVRYWVEEVAADGSRRWYGPARVLARRA